MKTPMLHYNSSSPITVLLWMKNFIIQFKNLAPQFCLPENDISDLVLTSKELEILLDKKNLSKPGQQTARTEIHRCIRSAVSSAITLIRRLRKDSNWGDACEKALQIHLLPRKIDFDGVIWKQKNGRRAYSNDECVSVVNWLKNIKNEFGEIGKLHWVSKSNSINLDDIIERTETVLNECTGIRDNYETISDQINNVMQKLRTNTRTIVSQLKSSDGWMEEHALLLNIYPAQMPAYFANFKPIVQLVNREKYVRINFSKTGVCGMNVYSRLQGKTNFGFIGYARRSGGFKDPCPDDPNKTETREYCLKAVVAGKEIGSTE